MESKMRRCCKEDINELRNELHKLIESESYTSNVVQKRSRELDKLITLYYRQIREANACRNHIAE